MDKEGNGEKAIIQIPATTTTTTAAVTAVKLIKAKTMATCAPTTIFIAQMITMVAIQNRIANKAMMTTSPLYKGNVEGL